VYPSAPEVPENLLKLYLEFSAPMNPGEAYQHIQLFDSGGQLVDAPFLELEPELWDPSGTRLTLLFDPGRIKRGLLPNLDVGPPLRAGRAYSLSIGAAWRDASGRALGETLRRPLRAVAADREPLDPDRWELQIPQTGARGPLVVRFGEPLDRALLEDSLHIEGPGGRVRGRASVHRGESEWQFTPELPWRKGTYSLHIEPRLEDLAGNRIGRAFDVDSQQQPSALRDAEEPAHTRSFRVD